jgi:hypothetical protein
MTKMLVREEGTTGRSRSGRGGNSGATWPRRTSQVFVHPILIAERSKLDNHPVQVLLFEVRLYALNPVPCYLSGCVSIGSPLLSLGSLFPSSSPASQP